MLGLYAAIGAIVAGAGLTALAIRLAPGRFLRRNFQGRTIPNACGLAFVLAASGYSAAFATMVPLHRTQALLFLVVAAGFGALGLIDDLYGDRTAGGLGGHFRALRSGKVTTGAVKAVGGVALALVCGWWADRSVAQAILAAVLIAGAANSLNLVDLRPGRCLALFFVGSLPVAACAPWAAPSHAWQSFSPSSFTVLCAILLYIGERRAKFMLGDTGANSFGAVLGLGFAIFLPAPAQIVIAALILVLHAWTERHSISRTIEASSILRRIDAKLGVRQ
ncbi:MAG: hypothetical protein P4L33_08845 [Capsulimonadaceae bacterium]|nr:hypothetical protein [Capsulimonadaceae bacterium]